MGSVPVPGPFTSEADIDKPGSSNGDFLITVTSSSAKSAPEEL